eukprot:jgi/Chlat1/8433/Chrsp80S07847
MSTANKRNRTRACFDVTTVHTDAAAVDKSKPEVGLDGWNEVANMYTFLYGTDNGKGVQVSIDPIMDTLEVTAVPVPATKGQEPVSVSLKVEDFTTDQEDTIEGYRDYASVYKHLRQLVETVQHDIIDKLSAPRDDAQKQAERANTESPLLDRRVRLPSGATAQQRPYEAELREEQRPLRDQYYGVPELGTSDLLPSGIPQTLGSPFGAPMPGFGGFDAGGSLMGPNHPAFSGGVPAPGYGVPMPGVPPGARFDPFGPAGIPGFEPGRFGDGGGPRGRGRGVHPDIGPPPGGRDFYM